jgi:SAM-dependent methyltransferase
MLKLAEEFVDAAERTASAGGTIEEVLQHLRIIDIDSFGLLLLTIPEARWPALSALLPTASSVETDRHLTGDTGLTLLQKSTRFVRSVSENYARYTGRPLRGARILDYGFGYGRLARLLLYFSDPGNLYGCDVAQRSLDWARDLQLPGNYVLIDETPVTPPFGGMRFDLIYAFSVFTHLSEPVMRAAMAILTQSLSPRGLLVLTIRPVEFWQTMRDVAAPEIADLIAAHEQNGFACRPHLPYSKDFGDTSLSFVWLRNTFPKFDLVGYDWVINDPHQIFVYLRPSWQFPD